MDFFEAQEHALRLSRRLILLFAAAVLCMIIVVYFVVLTSLGFAGVGSSAPDPTFEGWLNLELFGGVALGMGLIIGAGSAFRTAQLRSGGGSVARLLGGQPVPPQPIDPAEIQFRNVVEEMSIASGAPVPEIFVLDGETGINAFAAGHSIHDAAIAVTRGTLEALDRDELQGVVAHEFSHILNGDMRLNLRLVGLLFGILLLTVVGRGILRGSGGGRRGRGGGQIALLGLVLVLLGYLGVFFGRMIQAAVSRQREFLADAAAVQFTRNPTGIAGALKKIGGTRGSRVGNPHADEVGHLFFAAGLGGALSRLFATHPPLLERIRRIDPHWNGALVPGSGQPQGSDPSAAATAGLSAMLLDSVGNPGAAHIAHARTLLSEIPEAVRIAAQSPEGSVELMFALLLSDDGGIRSRQLEGIREKMGFETARASEALSVELGRQARNTKLPLLDLALPALRELSPERAPDIRAVVSSVIRADGAIQPFEFALVQVLRQNLADGSAPAPPARRTGSRLSRMRAEAESVLSALAHAGSQDPDVAQRSFVIGASRLFAEPDAGWRIQPPGAVDLERIDAALARLTSAAPGEIRRLLDAAIATIQADRRVEPAELELVRAVAEALAVPMPPVLEAHPS